MACLLGAALLSLPALSLSPSNAHWAPSGGMGLESWFQHAWDRLPLFSPAIVPVQGRAGRFCCHRCHLTDSATMRLLHANLGCSPAPLYAISSLYVLSSALLTGCRLSPPLPAAPRMPSYPDVAGYGRLRGDGARPAGVLILTAVLWCCRNGRLLGRWCGIYRACAAFLPYSLFFCILATLCNLLLR